MGGADAGKARGAGAPREGTCWAGPGRLRIAAVRLSGAHRVWANFLGIPPAVDAAFLVTDGGMFVGRGYYTSVEELAEVVDLSSLTPC